MTQKVVIVGGGLAGLAAAVGLAARGRAVTLVESRPRLGGRAGSFADPATGHLIDVCQHVSMGCCTNLAHFCRTVGIDHFLERQPSLYFMTPDRRVSRFRGDPWPAPLHLGRAFLGLHYLSPADKLRIGWGLACLRLARADNDEPLLPWLVRHRQSQAAIDRFWAVVLVSALNESPDRIGLRYARKVFVDGFLRHRRGFEVEVPSVPLGRLYGPELVGWLERHGVRLRLGQGVRSLALAADGRVSEAVLRDGTAVPGSAFIAAVPPARLLDLLPGDLVEGEPVFRDLRRLETSPITSVHLWYDRPLTRMPHVVLVDCLGQWVFSRGEVAPGQHHVQVVVSAARSLRALGHAGVEEAVAAELGRLFPGPARLLRARVLTEQQATFSVLPGADRFRPAQASPVPNLFLAGDWTATGWPATMEGAVRSGYLAVEALLRRLGLPRRLLQPDLY